MSDDLTIRGPHTPAADAVLTREARAFLVELHTRFNPRRLELLAARGERRLRREHGEPWEFPKSTKAIREGEWKVASVPKDLADRRVEITGPTDRKMIINALNSGAQVFMADFEDANTPTWTNLVEGQKNLVDAVRRTISYVDPQTGKAYALKPETAVLLVRPRGWHLDERHVLIGSEPIAGALFDFGLYFFHNASELLSRGTGPYFYLPKLESHQEARLWNDVFLYAQEALSIPRGSIRATVLIETILASFEMDEILYELKEHSGGLNAGRWDYIFSFIKEFSKDGTKILPDRAAVTMTTHFLRSYAKLLIRICHRRGTHAIGGMAAFIPIKQDPSAHEKAMAQVRADKEREAGDGHDGTWVAHPGLVSVAKEVFDRLMPGPNQIGRPLEDLDVRAQDLLEVPKGAVTEAGVRQNVAVGLGYLEAWLRGIGCVPLFNLMEDAATAEISRTQLWQWVHHGATLQDGRKVDLALCEGMIDEELTKARSAHDPSRVEAYEAAAAILRRLLEAKELADFLTIPAYEKLLEEGL